MVRGYTPVKSSNTSLLPPSLDELVKNEKNGLIFRNAPQLAEQLEVRPLTLSLDLVVDLMTSIGTPHGISFFTQTIVLDRFSSKFVVSTGDPSAFTSTKTTR